MTAFGTSSGTYVSPRGVRRSRQRRSAELVALIDRAKSQGVVLDVWESDLSPRLHIDLVSRHDWAPKGSGARVLRELFAYTDRTEQEVILFVLDDPLFDYYRALGFKRLGQSGFMTRRPS